MLSDEQLEIISEALQPLFQYLEHEVIADIVRRIKKTLTYSRTAELQALSMKALGYSPARIRKEAMKLLKADPDFRKQVAKNTLEYKREVRNTINDIVKKAFLANDEIVAGAGDMAWISDLSVWKDAGKTLTDSSYLHQLVRAFADQTAGELKNLTQTTGFKTMSGHESVKDAYRNELDKAVIKICSGTFSQDKVLRDTVHDLAQSGLRSIDFDSGRSMQLDTAARVAIRTGCHQLAGKVSDKNIAQTGENLVYVSRHRGARNTGIGHANHEQWQGKVYYIKPGQDYRKEAERIGQDYITDLWYATGYSVDGAHENDPSGLDGYNCRHNRHPWFEGVSTFPANHSEPDPEPVTINGRTYDFYAVTQKMRAMERSVRALKREKEALETLGMDTTEIRARIKRKTAEYKEFCRACGVPEKSTRLRYECGTSDLKKTEAWQVFNNMNSAGAKGALNDTNDPFGQKREKHAVSYYEEIRNRKPVYVINRIAQNANISKRSAKNIYEHIFINKHAFRSGEIKLFDPDYYMAESFRRILEGKNIKPHDIIMIKHENLELNLMKKYNLVYEDAHDLTNKKFNYTEALFDFLREAKG
ncbi:MAG: hypothetical protein HFI60_13335 [Lachnospiraceae bacterium]|jgi:hypothetical protein|nr:hypothetical protein [Lachnospiraceae bacterium]